MQRSIPSRGSDVYASLKNSGVARRGQNNTYVCVNTTIAPTALVGWSVKIRHSSADTYSASQGHNLGPRESGVKGGDKLFSELKKEMVPD